MSKNSNSRAAPSRKGSSLVAAVLVGMVLGLALAGGVAWYILKRPNPFVNNAPHEAKLVPEAVKPPPVAKVEPALTPADAADNSPRFEFYKVLTDQPDAAAPATPPSPKPAPKPPVKEVAHYFLQAGAFTNPDDADKLKARLTMLGMEPTVQITTLPDNSVWNRVRLGPYKNSDEMNQALNLLKQNGVRATRTQ